MEATETKQYIIVNLGTEQYGIEIKYIENIIVMQNITRVPKAQSYFLGVINLRGEVIPVMSLRKKLELGSDIFTSVSRIIIVKPEPSAAPVGIIVDEVKEVITLESSDVEMLNYDEKDEKASLSAGVGKYGNELINLLNIPGIVLEKEASKKKNKGTS
ncbi:purine-binding chemotaxis protein CheW [Mobilitalea sibirica]|uniref:Purine-binding chemotaxis protein CheW n=1 Tax=Mobilitalea sibirica TaxID=1462919 RepID=A0A8J7HCF3_9FIRM|nr:chemotaxis protein CheW [Mobilitalea sibirica]MBH1942011.1 purine-binding chemotaxis protein CheW [Mobilitalea sibirica]